MAVRGTPFTAMATPVQPAGHLPIFHEPTLRPQPADPVDGLPRLLPARVIAHRFRAADTPAQAPQAAPLGVRRPTPVVAEVAADASVAVGVEVPM
jgi:hypothetical protein